MTGKRKFKNYFLNPLQLKYSVVLLVFTIILYGVLGFLYYFESVKTDKMLTAVEKVSKDFQNDRDFSNIMLKYQAKEARSKLILMFVAAFVLVTLLFFTGIIITHRIAGPMFVFSNYVKALYQGNWHKLRPLRRSDEFQDFQEELNKLYEYLHDKEVEEIRELEKVLNKIEKGSVNGELVSQIKKLLKLKKDIVRV